jgi:lipoprotein-anchoring transpeptidase ErfK/SrfK
VLLGVVSMLGWLVLSPSKAEAALNPGLDGVIEAPSAATLPDARIELGPVARETTTQVRLAPDGSIDTPIPTDPATSQTPRQILPQKSASNPQSRYVVVDISEQTLYMFENGQVVDKRLISSGDYAHPTNIGTFRVFKRVADECMNGPGYSLCNVLYTQYFNDEFEALHYAWWHNNFGNRMSHGCVNMDLDTSRKLWYWAPANMKVVIKN